MRRYLFLLFLLLISLHTKLHSNGYLVPDIGGNFSGPTDPNPAALYWNPSAISFSKGTNIFLDLPPVYQNVSYERIEYGSDLKELNKYDETSASSFIPPPYFGLTHSVKNIPLSFGIAGYAHMGRMAAWDKDGPQRFNGTNALLFTANFGPAVSYMISQKLSVGAALNYIFGLLDAKMSIGLLNNEDPSTEMRAHLDWLKANAFSFSLGVTAKPVRGLTIGAAYLAPFKADYKGPAYITRGPEANSPLLSVLGDGLDLDAVAHQNFPQAINFGAKYLLSQQWESNFIAQWYDWSVNKNITVDLISDDATMQNLLNLLKFNPYKLQSKFVDTINWKFDLRYSPNKISKIGFGFGYDPSGIPSEYISALNLEFDKILAFISGEYRLSKNLKISGGFTHYQPLNSRHITVSNNQYSSTGFYRAIIEKFNVAFAADF
ncbi:MAG TPA: outer membrane protein transport protein [bacterium]